jgi:phage gpG-like protein
VPRAFAPGTVQILVFGEKQVAMNIRRGMAALGDMGPALTEVASDMMRVIGATITSGGRRYGGSWAALDPQTIKRKAAKGQDPRALIATGALLRAYSVMGAPNQILEVGAQHLRLESSLDYAEDLQTGTSRMPARPFINFYPQDRRRWAAICSEYLREAMAL